MQRMKVSTRIERGNDRARVRRNRVSTSHANAGAIVVQHSATRDCRCSCSMFLIVRLFDPHTNRFCRDMGCGKCSETRAVAIKMRWSGLVVARDSNMCFRVTRPNVLAPPLYSGIGHAHSTGTAAQQAQCPEMGTRESQPPRHCDLISNSNSAAAKHTLTGELGDQSARDPESTLVLHDLRARGSAWPTFLRDGPVRSQWLLLLSKIFAETDGRARRAARASPDDRRHSMRYVAAGFHLAHISHA